MEQIPMKFIVEQSDTYTEEDGEHVHVQGTGSEGLTKRQYTFHVSINAGALQKIHMVMLIWFSVGKEQEYLKLRKTRTTP